MLKINHLTLGGQKKKSKSNPKLSKRKGIKNRDLKLKLWETNKGCSINKGYKINKTDEPQARVTKKNERKHKLPTSRMKKETPLQLLQSLKGP